MATAKENRPSIQSQFQKFLCAGVLLLIGCQNPRLAGQWYNHSPPSASELGIVVDEVPLERIQQLVTSGRIGARILSQSAGTYEIYGLTRGEMAEVFPGKPFFLNNFIDFETPPVAEFDLAPVAPSPLPQLQIIHAEEAWGHSRGDGARVAVIDTGIAWDHSDFAHLKNSPNFSNGWNFGDGNADLSDPTGHGTAIAGLIASQKLGVAPLAQIIPLKVINSAFKIDEASVIAGIRFALEKDIPLIHFSLGRPTVSEIFLNLIKDVEAKGALIIAAAGNQGRSCDLFRQYPAGLDSSAILSVGATLVDLLNPFKMAAYSNFGDCVALAAPGGNTGNGLWAPLWHNSSSMYRTVIGTSMSAPLTTGAAAILISLYPEWNGNQIKNDLIASSQKSPDLEGYVKSRGLLRIRPPSSVK